MERQLADEPIRRAVTVPVPVDRAFSAFADLARWWPREYTWAADTLEDIGIEPREGGHCFERGPLRLHLPLGPGPDLGPASPPCVRLADRPRPRARAEPAKASEVEVRFHPAGTSGTRRMAPAPRPLRRHPPLT